MFRGSNSNPPLVQKKKKYPHTKKQIELIRLAVNACDSYDKYLEGSKGRGIHYRWFSTYCKKIAELSGIEQNKVIDALTEQGRGFTYEAQFDRLRAIGVDLGEKIELYG